MVTITMSHLAAPVGRHRPSLPTLCCSQCTDFQCTSHYGCSVKRSGCGCQPKDLAGSCGTRGGVLEIFLSAVTMASRSQGALSYARRVLSVKLATTLNSSMWVWMSTLPPAEGGLLQLSVLEPHINQTPQTGAVNHALRRHSANADKLAAWTWC